MTGLAFEDVAVARGERVLACGLTFSLGAGAAAMVTGPNGAGKSTLLRVAAGLLAPAAGRVRRDGRVALLAEAPALDGERRLRDALGFWAKLDAHQKNGGRVDLDAVGLGGLGAVPVRLLSTGQRRRAGLARVLASGAVVWLLDEPANGLDTDGVAMLEGLIAAHRAAGGVAVVATHTVVDIPDALDLRLPGESRGPAALSDAAEDGPPLPAPAQPGPGFRRGGEQGGEGA